MKKPPGADKPPRRFNPKDTATFLFWQAGDPHSLDQLDTDVADLDALFPQAIAHLITQARGLQQRLGYLLEHDLSSQFQAADTPTNTAIEARYGKRKHMKHLQSFFAWIRRKRFLGLLAAIHAALSLAEQLLGETTPFLSVPETITLPPEVSQHSRKVQRLQGIDEEPLTFLPDIAQSRQLLTQFVHQVPALKKRLSTGRGWFEVFFVPKWNRKPLLATYLKARNVWLEKEVPIPGDIAAALPLEVIAHIEAGKPPKTLPLDLRMQVMDKSLVGPYVRFRWQEGVHVYTISMGIPDDRVIPFTPAGE